MATNLDRYEDDLQFILLLNRCGLAGTQQEKITADGFTSMKILVDHYNFDPNNGFANYLRDLNSTFGNASNAERRVYYSPLLIVKLSGIVRYFIISVYSFHKLPDISQVNADVIALQAQLYSEVKRLKDNPDKSKEDNLAMSDKKLPTLQGQSNWVDYRDKLVIMLSHLPSRRGVHSLAYLVSEDERSVTRANANLILVDSVDISTSASFSTQVVHFGPTYKEDNKKLWGILESNLVNTHPYNHIVAYETSKDGRSAFFQLKAFFEGDDFKQRTQDSAMSTLSTTYYRGDSKTFKFEDYINAHMSAHKKLQQIKYNNGLGMDESTKVHYFKSNIRPDANLENSISLARSYEKRSFQEYVNFLATEVDFRNSRKKQVGKAGTRNVSSVSKGNKKNVKFSKKKPLGPMLYKTVEGKRIESKLYPREEYMNLSENQKKAVRDLNSERRRKSSGASNNSRDENKNVSAVSFRDELASLGDAIVAGVSRAVTDSNETDISSFPSQVMTAAKDKATSGSVGEFLAKRAEARSKKE